MTQAEATELYGRVSAELGLEGWRLVFDKAKRRFGQCRYGSRTISLSAPIVALNGPKEVEATIRHEIAHALVGPNHGHDEIWRAMAVRCGDDGRRCYDSGVEVPPAPFVAKCPGCGKEHGKHRAPKRMLWCRCGVAHKGKRFNPETALSFAPQPGTVVEPKFIAKDPQVLEVLRLRATDMGYVKIDAHFGIYGKKGWWSWKICKTFSTQ